MILRMQRHLTRLCATRSPSDAERATPCARVSGRRVCGSKRGVALGYPLLGSQILQFEPCYLGCYDGHRSSSGFGAVGCGRFPQGTRLRWPRPSLRRGGCLAREWTPCVLFVDSEGGGFVELGAGLETCAGCGGVIRESVEVCPEIGQVVFNGSCPLPPGRSHGTATP